MSDRSAWRTWRIVAAIVFVAAICVVVATAVRIQITSYTPIPYADLWDELPVVDKAFSGSLRLHDLLAQHNEHRIPLSRLQFIADYGLFGGRLVFLLAMIFMSSVLLAAVLTWPFARVWNDHTITLGFFAFALSATLTPAGWENLTWPFQVGFVQVYLFAVLAIALAVVALRLPDGSRRVPRDALVLAGIVAAAAAATYSIANGLVVWPILVGVLLLRRAGWPPVVVTTVAGLVSAAAYLRGYRSVAGHAVYEQNLEHPLGMARFIALFLGQPAHGLGSAAEYAVGVAAVALSLVVIVAAIRDGARPGRRATLFGAAVAVFVLVTATQTALGRLQFGLAQAETSRYAIAPAVLWTALAAGVAPLVALGTAQSVRARNWVPQSIGLAFVAACLAVSFLAGHAAAPSNGLMKVTLQRRGEPLLIASVTGVKDEEALYQAFPVPARGSAVPGMEWLRAERLGPWSTGAAETLEAAQRDVPGVAQLPPCTGNVDAVKPVGGGERFDGWIAGPAGRSAAAEVTLVDATGASNGVGRVDFYRPDVKAANASPSNWRGMVAYDRAGAEPAAHLVLFDSETHAPLCALPIRRP